MIETSEASHPFAPVPHLPAICISLLLLILTSNLFSCIYVGTGMIAHPMYNVFGS